MYKTEEGKPVLTFDERQINEIRHSLFYQRECGHGTVGHNVLMINADMAQALGFGLADDNKTVTYQPQSRITIEFPTEAVALLVAEG